MCSHPVIYHVDGKMKCIACGEILEEHQENGQKQAESMPADSGVNKSTPKKRQAKNAK